MQQQQVADEFHAEVVRLEWKVRNGGLTVVEALNLEWLYNEGGY